MSGSEQQQQEEPPGGSTDHLSRGSVLSLKSDDSRNLPPMFQEPGPDSESGGSGLSVKSDDSRNLPPTFQDPGPGFEDGCTERLTAMYDLDAVFRILQEDILTFVKQELRSLQKLLTSEQSERSPERSSPESGKELSHREAVLNIALDLLRKRNLEQLAQQLQKRHIFQFQSKLKHRLQHKFSRLYEGVAKEGDHTPLKQIYTELYITEGGASEVNQEHEVRHMEMASRKLAAPETVITCEDMFKQRPDSEEPIRTVLTKGVAGVGKTVLTQKFSLDWAEGKTHQNIQLLFPFTFRELNVLRDTEFSLMDLLHHFFIEIKGLHNFQQLQLLFIFDGLDECRLPLDFSRTRFLTEPTESAPVEVLLVNLIRGSLLPSARVWITTRPAAANQIPAECVSMVTEVRGFTDPQKEQYFMKRFRVKAMEVISHIRRIRSLYIMCHIPVFCWILYEVIQMILEQTEKPQLPKTLTEMYIHFLVVQAKIKNIKYHEGTGTDLHWTPETKKMVNSLGKLAFEQLQKGNLIFYESDLSECGQDTAEIAGYSGVFTQVFREEPGLYQDKVYCFIHLSVQEFLAALHVHQTFFSSGENLLSPSHSSESPEAFYCSAVDQALQSPNGHLDLFLRFLLGLSLPTNQRLLPYLLTETGSDQTNQKTVKYIKEKLNEEGLSTERSLNLLHCLNELNDLSLIETIQQNTREGAFSDRNMSPAQWSALSYVLLSSNSDLDEFDLRKYCPTEKGLLGLLPVIKASTKAILSGCNLTQNICAPLASVLSSSSLTELDLSNNDLQDSGVELLCEGLKNNSSKLQTLRLRTCNLSQEVCAPLASVLSSSGLTHLDLSNNDLQDSGVELLVKGLKSTSCRLDTLGLSGCNLTQNICAALASVLSSSSLTDLDLINNDLQDSGMKLLCEGLKNNTCRLQTLRLRTCNLSQEVCAPLASVLSSSSLTELDLSNNDLQDSGVELLCEGLKSNTCKLQTVRLSGCLVSQRGVASLASALSSSSNLRDLDLSYNHPGDSAELLTALKAPQGPLQTLRLDPAGEQWMVPGLRKYYREVTLDPNKADAQLRLSENKRTVSRGDSIVSAANRTLMSLFYHDRFSNCRQVLSSSGLRGRCYWEVEWKGWDIDIAVSSREIKQSGVRSVFGGNDHSWTMRIKDGQYFLHNDREKLQLLSVMRRNPNDFSTPSGRVGVFLESDSGRLSFYRVGADGELSHLHTFTGSFTEPLFAGFGLWWESNSRFSPASVSLLNVKTERTQRPLEE